jgi:hypothetical protein
MRRAESFNIAFLDIMACGLGAVVLILVLLKGPGTAAEDPNVSLVKLEEKIRRIQAKNAEVVAQIKNIKDRKLNDVDKNKKNIETLAKLKQAIEKNKIKISALDARLSERKEEPKKPKKPKTKKTDQHLLGLDVYGKKIVILVDRSGSMVHESLLEISLSKARGKLARVEGKKWARAQKIASWIIQQVPAGSVFQVVAFNHEPKVLTKSWISKSDVDRVRYVEYAIKILEPTGGTNLEKAFTEATKLGPDGVYLITDGLPTLGEKSNSVIPRGGCGGPFKQLVVSGECRVTLMTDVISGSKGFKGRVSGVLLPLEGDPQAAPLFSKWALQHRGKLISPPREWP